MTDTRPQNCRFRLQDEGKGYPRSSCRACGRTITTGLGSSCHHSTIAEADTPIDREARDFLSKNQGRNPLTWQEAAQIADAACCIIRALLDAKEAAEAERDALRDALEWYRGNVSWCNNFGPEGREARDRLAKDVGARAETALAQINPKEGTDNDG